MKVGNFYDISYIPNRIVYVISIGKEIKFLAFFNEGNGLQAIEHSLPIQGKSAFKPHKGIVPQVIKDLI